MFHVVLFEPEIPPNTGNIIRLCAVTGCQLHLIHPLGFNMNDKQLRRAGLDYHEFATVQEYDHLDDFFSQVQPKNCYACTTKGRKTHSDVQYQAGDAILLGPETRGLPESVLKSDAIQDLIRIPMKKNTRSLNLSNATAIIVYEAWRQLNFIEIE